jgi:hypothetical protein
VLRASVLSIVLLLAAGPDTALVCGLWCHHASASMADCDHTHSGVTPSVSSDDACWRAAVGTATFVREDARGTSDNNARHAVVVPGSRVPVALGDAHVADHARAPLRGWRPPLVTLRI